MSIEKLDHLSLLKITGDDAPSFLQGQLTNDINLADKEWQYSGYCNPKGRLLALFSLWRYENTTFMLLDKSLTETIIKRLTMYVMRSNVKIELAEHKCFGLIGEQALEEITNTKSNTVNHRHAIHSNGEDHILGYGERYLFVTQKNHIEPLPENETSKWQKKDIEEGLPEVSASSSELFIPQMLNLDIINGVNFKKGCYTGQEIVARMHYLGKSKQRMFVCNVNNTKTSLLAGSKIYNDNSLTKTVGNIVSMNDDKALAVLRIEDEMTDDYFLDENTSIKILNKQPYSIERN